MNKKEVISAINLRIKIINSYIKVILVAKTIPKQRAITIVKVPVVAIEDRAAISIYTVECNPTVASLSHEKIFMAGISPEHVKNPLGFLSTSKILLEFS